LKAALKSMHTEREAFSPLPGL